jgi:thiol-disulfide isomerase/thioredoxin
MPTLTMPLAALLAFTPTPPAPKAPTPAADPPTSASSTPQAEPSAPTDSAARDAYEACAAAVAALGSVELRIGSSEQAKDARVWRQFPTSGDRARIKTRIEYADGSVLVSDGTRAVLTRADKKTYRELDASPDALAKAVGMLPDWWMIDLRWRGADGEARRSGGESFAPLAADAEVVPVVIGGTPCDVVHRTVRGTATAEVGGKVYEVPMVFEERLAIGRTDRLPRRFEQSTGASRERPDLVAPPTWFAEIVAVNPHLAPEFDAARFAVPTRADLEGDGFVPWTPPVPKPRSPLPPLAAGDMAPDFALKDLDGREVRLSQLRGKVVVLDVWATWCGPCRAAMPFLDELHREYQANPATKDAVVFLALNTSESDPEKARRYFREKGYGSTCLLESDETQLAYRVGGLPAFFVIAPDGRIAHAEGGFGSEGFIGNLRERIDAARK